jgi:TolA-binding protein
MRNLSPKWRRFIKRRHRQLNSILTLLLITVFISFMTGGFFPWLFIPIFFIGLSIIQDFADTLMSDDEEEEEDGFEDDFEYTDDDEEFTEEYPTVTPVTTQTYSATYNPTIQAHLDKAHLYKEQIESYIQATSDPHSQSRLQDLSDQISQWTEAIEAMARRIDSFQQNPVINQDLKSVPQAIKKLETQLDRETDPTICAELERTLANRKNQLATLQRLENTMKQAEIKMESTLASLGTIYSQLLTSQSTDHVADYSRLSTEVNEEVQILQDHLEALGEVKLGRYN